MHTEPATLQPSQGVPGGLEDGVGQGEGLSPSRTMTLAHCLHFLKAFVYGDCTFITGYTISISDVQRKKKLDSKNI